MVEVVEHGVDQGFDLEVGPSLGDEVQIDEEGVFFLRHPTHIDDSIKVPALVLLRNVSDLSSFKDEEVIVVLEWLHDLLRVVNAHLYLFSQRVKGLIHQVVEES